MAMAGKRVIAIIQARSGSKRLPEKVLLDLCGQPSLRYVIERVKASQYIDEVVLATTELESDDRVAAVAEGLGVSVFRGAEDDVLGRFCDCLKSRPSTFDYMVRVCADNFVICASVIDRSLEELHEKSLDIVNPFMRPTYPFGSGAEVATTFALRRVNEATLNAGIKYREHIFFFAYDHPEIFKTGTVLAPSHLSRPQLNLSVDTSDDFQKIEGFIDSIPECERMTFELDRIIDYFDSRDAHQ